MRRKVAIVGYGETKFERRTEKSEDELLVEATANALEDTQMDKNAVDAVFSTPPIWDVKSNSAVINDYLQLNPKMSSTVILGGAAHGVVVEYATMAIALGLIETALIVGGGKFEVHIPPESLKTWAHPEFEIPYGPTMPALYAMPAVRHMAVCGTTEEQLASVVVAHREWAERNPAAIFRQPITVDEVLKSPMIAYPYRLLMCSYPVAGAGAFILTSAENAKNYTDTPVYVLGWGEYHSHAWVTSFWDMTEFGSLHSGREAYRMADVEPKQIDLVMAPDPFPIAPIIHLEDLGFCKKGEGGKLFEDGRCSPGGDIPFNTHGGLLACAHTGMGPLIHHLIEATRQITGDVEKERRLSEVDIALIQMHGGMMNYHCTLIIGR